LDAWPTVPDVFEIIESASQQSDYTEVEAKYEGLWARELRSMR
jgi:hypothetical protein